jgi:UDP-N-acetylglucosamine 1-carboxyvinyltransferase
MVVAGLTAEGETVICDDGHITRGYEQFDRRLRALGADIVREY